VGAQRRATGVIQGSQCDIDLAQATSGAPAAR
jgi:hypothetical protein